MAYETYGQINGVIRRFKEDSCCSQILRLDTENGEVRFTVMADTMIENVRLRRECGCRVYDTTSGSGNLSSSHRAEINSVRM